MAKLTSEERRKLLSGLRDAGAAGQAEREDSDTFKKTFLPVPEHMKAFEPDVVLVIGERGVGKSELFRAVIQENLLPQISRYAIGTRLPPIESDKVHWRTGAPLLRDFPDTWGLRAFRNAYEPTSHDVNSRLWFLYLIRTLSDLLDDADRTALQNILKLMGGEIQANWDAFLSAAEKPLLALDRLDQKYQKEDRWVFIGYDELDTLGGTDWDLMGWAIRGLVQFWSDYSRRWKRIRPKIFLRTDLFRRHTSMLGAELPKLAANRAELSWSDRNLYAMLIKRIANKSVDLFDFCEKSRIVFDKDDVLGFVPRIDKVEDAKPLIEKIADKYMGSGDTGKRKGITFRWILEHTRDGRGKAIPRPFVKLIEYAAMHEIENPRAQSNTLIHPTALRRAVDSISADQVTTAIAHEWPWLHGVKERVKADRLVPWEKRSIIEKVLYANWDDPWGHSNDIRPPVDYPRDLVDYLVELGVFRDRPGGRIDVPDLYLSGLDLKRKGGVKKK